jgi:hypothetical protein
MAFRFISALVLRPILGFPICCFSLFQLNNTGAWSSSWGHRLAVHCHRELEALPGVWVFAAISRVLGSGMLLLTRFSAVFGLPLIQLISHGLEGRTVPLGGVPRLTATSLLLSRHIHTHVIHRSLPVTASAKQQWSCCRGGLAENSWG